MEYNPGEDYQYYRFATLHIAHLYIWQHWSKHLQQEWFILYSLGVVCETHFAIVVHVQLPTHQVCVRGKRGTTSPAGVELLYLEGMECQPSLLKERECVYERLERECVYESISVRVTEI